MSDVILHHYPQSPVSEKIRVAFGIKGLSWRSVEIPRLPPKPDLMPLTAGYRRTPVMQIGADIYCDSHCILRALEVRFPEPTFHPGGNEGLIWGLSRWSDGPLFDLSVKLVLAAAADSLPEDFARDRGRLYLGPDHDLQALKAEIPHMVAQLRGQFAWMADRLADSRSFMLGATPALPDALCYYLVWFIRGRWAGGPALLAQFSLLEAWEARVKDLGHGTVSELSAQEALQIAKAASPTTETSADPNDGQQLQPGDQVAIKPDVDGGDPEVVGEIQALDCHGIAIRHENPQVGEICIHFPRVGYYLRKL